MNKLLRKLRGVMSIGLIWGILWVAFVNVLGMVIWVIHPDDIDPGEGPLVFSAIFGMVGLISGIGFGILLSFAESGKTIRDIWLPRAAIWGMLGSAAFPLLTGREDQVFIMCPLGAVIATALVAIARRATLHDAEQPQRLLDVIFGYVLTFVQDAVNPPKEPST